MKVHPILTRFFSNVARVGFIQILYHCSVSWKITPPYFFISNLAYFGQKEPIKVKFSDFWVVEWNLSKFLMLYLKPQVSFSSNFASLFNVMRENSSVIFRWNFIWFGQKESIKVQNFKLFKNFKISNFKILTVHVKFHQIYTLIGSFCWKYIKFELIQYRGVMFHDNEEWCRIWRGMDLLFRKWHEESNEFWPKHSKVSKMCTLMGSFWPNYIMLELSTEELCLMAAKTDAKFEGKLTGAFKFDIWNLANFHRLKKVLSF